MSATTAPNSTLMTTTCQGSVLAVSGEVDMSNSHELRAALEQCFGTFEEKTLVLDLRGLDFIDMDGAGTILAFRAICREHGCELRVLVKRGAIVQRALGLSGLLHVLHVEPVE